MDISELLDGLNDKQREAVTAPLGNYLVLAGAGSGKTRVLTHRIAWLVAVENISEGSIMAVTFTNKAAAEMRHRIQTTLSQYSNSNLFGMWIGTFHSIAHRLLRAHHLDVGLPQDFQILDSEDQLRLVKRLLKLHNFDEKAFPPKQACWYINNKKMKAYDHKRSRILMIAKSVNGLKFIRFIKILVTVQVWLILLNY
ncbi:DNA helicase II [Rodentibacter pneumotropicus]|uniref:DNA 3'-5' helicase II n=1 Tax=Rodentibacter pneumotropicus TaxID=758 RepID=A0A448MS90_9PAST|nr:DNA helicase II [Rodentibacter pneumotropicus]